MARCVLYRSAYRIAILNADGRIRSGERERETETETETGTERQTETERGAEVDPDNYVIENRRILLTEIVFFVLSVCVSSCQRACTFYLLNKLNQKRNKANHCNSMIHF